MKKLFGLTASDWYLLAALGWFIVVFLGMFMESVKIFVVAYAFCAVFTVLHFITKEKKYG